MPDDRSARWSRRWVAAPRGRRAGPGGAARARRARLARFKVPRHGRFVDAFPLTVTGKVQKFRMREAEVELLAAEAAAAG